MAGCGQHQDRHGTRRARHEVDRVAHRERRRRDEIVERPARRRDVSPGAEVARLPVAVAERLEQVVAPALDDDDRVGARAIRDPLVLLLEVVAVVDVDRVGVGAMAECVALPRAPPRATRALRARSTTVSATNRQPLTDNVERAFHRSPIAAERGGVSLGSSAFTSARSDARRTRVERAVTRHREPEIADQPVPQPVDPAVNRRAAARDATRPARSSCGRRWPPARARSARTAGRRGSRRSWRA